MCAYTKAPHAIGVSSGTDALLAILMALGIGPGDSVLTTAYTFFATASCVARVGATPVFVDIDPVTYNISPAAIETYLRERCRRESDGRVIDEGGRTLRAIVPVHLFGLCCEMDAINEIAAALRLARDRRRGAGDRRGISGQRTACAQAGTMGPVGYFSFYPSKNLGAAGDAGLIVCQRGSARAEDPLVPAAWNGAALLPSFHRREFPDRCNPGGDPEREAAAPRRAGRRRGAGWLTSIAKSSSDAASRRRSRCRRSRIAIDGLTNHHIYHQFVIRTARRDALREHLTRKEIGNAIYYPLGASPAGMLCVPRLQAKATCRKRSAPRVKRSRCRSIQS